MKEDAKRWGIYLLIWCAALAASWGWTKLHQGNLAYALFLTQRSQENIARQQQLEANELQLRQSRSECCECLPEEEEPEALEEQ
jgi:hypothetical protein